jgi:hypothetical protein
MGELTGHLQWLLARLVRKRRAILTRTPPWLDRWVGWEEGKETNLAKSSTRTELLDLIRFIIRRAEMGKEMER